MRPGRFGWLRCAAASPIPRFVAHLSSIAAPRGHLYRTLVLDAGARPKWEACGPSPNGWTPVGGGFLHCRSVRRRPVLDMPFAPGAAGGAAWLVAVCGCMAASLATSMREWTPSLPMMLET
jgi:hypothetical protein